MLTRTLPSLAPSSPITPSDIQSKVDQRWFYLYEWISPEELRMTGERDYLRVVKSASIPLAVITVIAGLIGFSGWVFGTILAILWVLGVFYAFVFVWLFLVFLRRAYFYTRSANVVITDDHYISGGEIIEKKDVQKAGSFFEKIGNMFDERFLEDSRLAEKKERNKNELFDNLKNIAFWWWKIIQNMWRSRDAGGIIMVLLIAGIIYGVMMSIVYFIGVFFITVFGRIFSWIAHLLLLASNNTEYTIQNLFSGLDQRAYILQNTNTSLINHLEEAGQNAWKENLLGKINDSLTLLSEVARASTDDSGKLRKVLESSKYKEIFNFTKYGKWVKNEILEPIESILLLLSKNRDTLKWTLDSLKIQISHTTDPSLQKPLILQKERLELQSESFEKNIAILEGYKEKLQL